MTYKLGAWKNLEEKLLRSGIDIAAKETQISLESKVGSQLIGCILMQYQADGRRKPLSYWSRSFTAAEK